VTVHERPVGATVEWYTPPELFDALGVRFDLDPAGAVQSTPSDAYCHVVWTRETDGLSHPWFGHVWLNPPYGREAVPFIDRMIAHGDGLMLLPSRTETAAYQRALVAASAVCFLRDRLWFIRNDDYQARSSFGSTLFAFGSWATGVLHRADVGYITGD
jgi:hypothetical protein